MVAAAVGEFSSKEKDTLYLQPYGQYPSVSSRTNIPFPAFEMSGPFVGHVVTQPRLRSHDYQQACEALWTAMEEMLRVDEKEEEPMIPLPLDDKIDEL